MTLPLAGIRVLDLSRALPGPFCTQILADFGADIIKIEDRGGDPARHTYPQIVGKSARFYAVNRNKKSLTLDLRKEEGQAIFKKLAARSDIVLDVFRPGIMDRMGLGYEQLREINPRIIYCALNGFGSTGPLMHSPAHDINILSLAGILDLTGTAGGQPALSGVQIAGLSGSLYAVIAILISLINRNTTGKGQFCDVSMLDAAISLLAYTLAEWSGLGRLPIRGRELLTGGFAYFNVYETSDKQYISLGASELKFWTRVCHIIGRPDFIPLHKDPERQEEMTAAIKYIIKQKTRAEWVEAFSVDDACFTPVLNLEEAARHPQVRAREAIIRIPNFNGSSLEIALPGQPVKLSQSKGKINLKFPGLGQHNQEILSSLGYSEEEIGAFTAREVI